MLNDSSGILIVVLFAGGLLGVITYHVTRFLRGSITITLPRTAYMPGEVLSGSLELHAKKAIVGNRLTVSLVGLEVTRVRANGKTSTQTSEIYRDEVVLEDAASYPPGHRSQHFFTLAVPNPRAPELPDVPMAQALETAVKLFGNCGSRQKWRLEARLDAKGVDLVASRPLSIELNGFF